MVARGGPVVVMYRRSPLPADLAGAILGSVYSVSLGFPGPPWIGCCMNLMSVKEMHERLHTAGVSSEPGLTDQEIHGIEERYRFRFPPDLREFLAHALPRFNDLEDDALPRWADWRGNKPGLLQEQLDWPLEGMCFDIENNDFWIEEWGERPEALEDRFDVARRAVEAAPVLIPLCGHRYMPSLPDEAGNPVFSVYQTDIILYGDDLLDYLANEFPVSFPRPGPPVKRIVFWSALAQ